MEERSSSERKNLLIKTISIVILMLLALLSSILYIFAYPKTKVILYDNDYRVLRAFEVKKYSKLTTLPDAEKEGYTFQYWTYENGDILDPTKELDSDTLSLYAVYNVNSYRVTYHVQVINPVTGKYEYKEDVQGCLPQTYEFGQTFRLPTGKDSSGNYIEEFAARKGHTFVGWTTKAYTEDDPQKQVYNAGGEFIVPAGNIDLYAHWEKNKYEVVLHTGIEYQFENGIPVKDINNKFIIKNNQEEAVRPEIKYLDYLSGLTSRYENITLNEERDGLGAEEYDFRGWYLDPDYIVKADDYNVEVNVDDEGVPYFKYLDENKQEKKVYAVETDGYYQFHLYSKWERRAYNLTFNKNTNRSNGKIDPIQVYKYDDLYGKYYNTEVFTRQGQLNGDYYHTLDLSNLEVTTEAFLNSNKNYRFIGWTTRSDASKTDNVWYYQWTQSKEIEQSTYINKVYKHEVSQNVTLYAQWSRVYTITFADNTTVNKKTFVKEGIEGEWFNLPSSSYIADLGWTKDFNSFAGWTTNPSSTLATRYYELLENGESNPDYMYTISRANAILYVLWEREQYRIDFYLNYGSENNGKGEIYTTYYPVYGGSSKSYPSTPIREGYIFDGWSQTKYADNVLNKNDAYTSAKSFKVVGDAEYYASWTLNYLVEYNANGGIGTLPKTLNYKNNYRDLKMTVSVGGGTKLQMSGHTFAGWVLKKNDNNLDTSNIISSGTSLVFDYANHVVYKESNPDVKYPMNLEGDLDNKVVLYAYWEPRQFSITLVDTLNNNEKTIEKATYGVDFVFPVFDKNGYKFDGWASEQGGTVIYTPGSSMPGSSVVSNYTFYTIYSIKKIALEYWCLDVKGGEVQYTQTGAFSYGTINYNQTIILPTPSYTLYGDSTYLFKEWYYVDDAGNEIVVTTGESIRYEGEKLILWARFEKEKYTAIFEINLTDGTSAIDPISIDLDKNYVITNEFIEELMLEVDKVIERHGIKAYNFAGFYNDYRFNAVNPLKLVAGQGVNDTTFPVLKASSIIRFTGKWVPNAVSFEYRSSESDYQQNNSFHTGLNYESTSEIVLKNQTELDFKMGDGTTITRWYIKEVANPDRKAYFTVGANLIGGNSYVSISELDKYITWNWNDVEERYDGIVYLYAETEQVFDIIYYRYINGAEEVIKQEQIKYDAYNNLLTLASGLEATYGNMIFNGWRLGSMAGELITNGLLELSSERFGNYQVKLFADLSFNIDYKFVSIDGSTINIDDLKTETYNYYNNNAYVNSINISEMPTDVTIPDGYIYYGLKYKDTIYSSSQVTTDGINVLIDGTTQTILCYITKMVTITYSVREFDEIFDDGSNDSKSYTYQIGFDGVQIDTITIKNLSATKPNHVFVGWSISYSGIPDSRVYHVNEALDVTENTMLVAVFEIPQAGNINAIITYLENDSANANSASFDVKNGDSHTLLGNDDLGASWISLTQVIIGWRYTDSNGNIYDYNVGDTFTIPLAITSGDEFKFIAIWDEYYTIKFNPDLTDATLDTTKKTLLNGQEFKLTASEEPKLEVNATTKFQYWTYEGAVDSDTNNSPIIRIGDIIKISNKTNTYYKEETFEYTIHTIPRVTGVWEYTLKAVWDKEDFVLTLNITDPNSPDDNEKLLLTYTLGGTTAQKVYYGDSFEARDLLNSEALALEDTYPNSGIIGWRDEKGDPTKVDHDIITNITSNLTLYAVWQTKYTLTYSAPDGIFGYKESVQTQEYFFKEDTIDFNVDIIKSIYRKGYYTVYFDNGEYSIYQDGTGTDYYTVIGFTITKDGGSSEEHLFSVNGYSFETPDANITLTPIFGNVYTVKFYFNGLNDNEVVKTIFKVKDDNLLLSELNKVTATRINFNFLGWNTNKESTSELKNDILKISNNINLYAIWQSTLSAQFYLQGEKVFEVPLNRLSKISSDILIDYLTDEKGSESNGYLANSKLGENPNVYTYNNLNYYLNDFVYNSEFYNLEELCELTLNRSIIVNFNMEDVYTIKYSLASDEEVVGEINDIEYITASGKLTATAKDNSLILPLPSVTKEYHTPIGWSSLENYKDTSSKTWNAGTEFTNGNIGDLIELSKDQIITLYIKWDEETYDIILKNLKEGLDLYTVYSNSVAGTDNEFLNSFDSTVEFVKNTNGTKMTESGNLQLFFGQQFKLGAPSKTFNNYTFVGWSTALYKLGQVPEGTDFYPIYTTSTLTLTVTADLLNANNEIVFYPVYMEDWTYIDVIIQNGQANVEISNNNKLKGFIYDGGYKTDTPITINGDETILISYYNDVVVSANAPNANYEFEKFEGIGSTSVDPAVRTISYGDVTNEDYILLVNYKAQEIEVTLELVYTNELKSNIAIDGSTITFGSTTLSANHKTETIIMTAFDTINFSTNTSDYYNLKSITSNGTVVTSANSITLSDLVVENKKSNIIVTLTPKTYTVTFNLNNGVIENAIQVTSNIYEGIVPVEVVDNKIEVVANAEITLPTPTKVGFVFTQWILDGQAFTETTKVITANTVFTAMYYKDQYIITYNVKGVYTQSSFVGGQPVIIAENIEFNEPGEELDYWVDQFGNEYKTGDSVTLNKNDYTLTAVIKGKNITITYHYGTDNALEYSQIVEYGKPVVLKAESDLSSAQISGKNLYAWTRNSDGTGTLIKAGQECEFGLFDFAYNDSTGADNTLHIYAVYFVQYKFTINYALGTDSQIAIPSETYYINAIDADGSVEENDLRYTISSIVPKYITGEKIIEGYNIKIGSLDNTIVPGVIVACGGVINLTAPTKDTLEYEYYLIPKWEDGEGTSQIRFYIINPEEYISTIESNPNVNIYDINTLDISDTNSGDSSYYQLGVFASNKLVNGYLPQNDLTSTWKISIGSIEFNTPNFTNFVGYKLIGYKIYASDESGNTLTLVTTINLTDSGDSSSRNFAYAGAAHFRAYPIWEQRYLVNYYDQNGVDPISGFYVDKNTTITLETRENYESLIDNYSLDNHVLIGFANRKTTSASPILPNDTYYNFGNNYIVTSHVDFYPAFAKLYSIVIDVESSKETLTKKGGNADSLIANIAEDGDGNVNIPQIHVGNSTMDLTKYCYPYYSEGIGYEFVGFSLIAEKMAYELDSSDIFKSYTLDISDAVDGVITFYIIMDRDSVNVTFYVNAKYKDNSKVSNTTLKKSYYYNDIINLDDSSLDSLKTLENFNFVDFSFDEAGTSKVSDNYKVTAGINIYINFNPIYRLQFVIPEDASCSDLPEIVTVNVGDIIEYFDPLKITYENYLAQNWYLEGTDRSLDFFNNKNPHIITDSDLEKSNNEYILIIKNNWNDGYLVSFKYFASFSDFENGVYTETSAIPLKVGDSLFATNSNELEYNFTKFDGLFIVDGTPKTFIEMVNVFTDHHYVLSLTITVNGQASIGLEEYIVKKYGDNNPGKNIIELTYEPVRYEVDVYTALATKNEDGEYEFNENIDEVLVEYTLNNAENKKLAQNQSTITLTYMDTIQLLPESEWDRSYSSNKMYTFIGWKVVVGIDDHGHSLAIAAEKGSVFETIISNSNYGISLLSGFSYQVSHNVAVYAVFEERYVNVKVVMQTEDNILSSIKAEIKVNNISLEEDDVIYTYETISNIPSKIATVQVKYGALLEISGSDTSGAYVFDGIKYSGIILNQSSFITYLQEEYGIVNNVFELTILYSLKTIDVYLRTLLNTNLFGEYRPEGEISSYTYIDRFGDSQEGSKIYFANERYDNKLYASSIQLSYNSQIDKTFAIPVIDNYTFLKWNYYSINSGSGELGDTGITLTDNIYLEAVYIPNEIEIEFYDQDNNILEGIKYSHIDSNSDGKLTYGDSMILPYVIVNGPTSISVSWNKGEFGEEIVLISGQANFELENNIYKLKLNSRDKYYVVFGNSEDDVQFNIPSQYPTSKNNDFVVSYESLVIDSGITYFYKEYNLDTSTYSTISEITTIENTTLISNKITIPNEEIAMADGLVFKCWIVGNREFANNTEYLFAFGDIGGNNTIKLTAKSSSFVNLKFYITNPNKNANNNESEFLNLSKSAVSPDYSIEFFPVTFNLKNLSFSNLINITESNDNHIKWENNSNSYFTVNSDVMSNYKFYGWSIVNNSPIGDINKFYSSLTNNSALIYTWADDKLTNSNSNSVNSKLYNLIMDGNNTFYSVWEEKHEVKFNASDSAYTNGFTETKKYGAGESVEMPNPNNNSLANGNQKWTGWKTKDGSGVYEFTNSNYLTTYPSNIELVPTWVPGINVYFDVNFDSQRQYFANIMQYAGTNNYQTIYTKTGIPNINSKLSGYNSAYTQTINGKTYITTYKEGHLWTVGDVVDISKYADKNFVHEGIYYLDGIDSTLSKYFYLAGWVLDGQSDYLNEYTIKDGDIAGGSITFKAIWKPVEVSVRFYYDKESAESSDSSNAYMFNGKLISISVPFGYFLSTQDYSDYSNEYDNYVNIYENYPVLMNPINMQYRDNSDDWRFNFWTNSQLQDIENVFQNDASGNFVKDTISKSRVISDLKLYPTFVRQYEIEFVSLQGNPLNALDSNQKVIDQEDITIIDVLSKIVDTSIVSSVYYYNTIGNKVNVDVSTDTIQFIKSQFAIDNDKYIYIYVEVNIQVQAYIPNYSSDGTIGITALTPTPIILGNDYNINALYPIDDTTLRSYTNTNNYPSFGGWRIDLSAKPLGEEYYNLSNTTAYKLNDDSVVEWFGISSIKIGNNYYYSLVLNGKSTNLSLKVENGALVVKVYLRLLTSTTISLGSSTDHFVKEFGYLTIEDMNNLDDLQEYYNITNSVIIENSTSTGITKYKSITYTSVYYGGLGPVVTINNNYGYTIVDTNNSDIDELISNNSNLASGSLYEEYANFNVSLERITSTEVDANNIDQLRIKNILQLTNIKNTNNIRIELYIAPITYNVTYSYDINDANLTYKTSNVYGATTYTFENTQGETREIQIIAELFVYGHGGAFSKNYIVKVGYQVEEVGSIINIKFTNVPYGISLYNTFTTKDILLKHFIEFDTDGLNNIGTIENGEQTFIPLEISNNEYVTNFTIRPVFEKNEVNTINFVLDFDSTYFEKGSYWHNLLEKANFLTKYELDERLIYRMNFNSSSFNNVYAGDDISSIISEINNNYHQSFNSDVAINVGTIDQITSSYVLLNYFWFDGKWFSYVEDSTCAFDNLTNIVKVDTDGVVTLYTKLDKGVIVSTTHKTVDYKDGSKVYNVDRADIDLVKITATIDGKSQTMVKNKDYYLFTANNAERIIIKMPYGYEVEMKVSPVSHTADHNAYVPYRWVLDTGTNKTTANGFTYVEGGDTATIDTENNGKDMFYKYGGFGYIPEINVIAQVTAETYQVLFVDTSNSDFTYTCNLAYDKEIADANTNNFYYASTLSTLRNESRIQLFALDSKVLNATTDVPKIIKHKDDTDAVNFGEFKYLLLGWASGKASESLMISVNSSKDLISYSTKNGYQTVTLYTKWNQNVQVNYNIYGTNGVSQKITYYLPLNDITDCFGNEYSSSLAYAPALKTIEEINSKYLYEENKKELDRFGISKVTSHGTLYDMGKDDWSHKAVTKVAEAIRVNNTIDLYPVIVYDITIYQNKNEQDMVDRTISTLGGKYNLTNLKSTDNKGYIQISNIVLNKGDENCISYNQNISRYIFAFWELYTQSIESEVFDELFLGNSLDIYQDIIVNSHYNPTFKIDDVSDSKNKGTITFVDKNGQSSIGYNIAIFNSVPSDTHLTANGNNNQKVVKVLYSQQSNTYAKLEVTGGSQNHILEYKANAGEQLSAIYWILTFEDGSKISMVIGDEYIIEDSRGSFDIDIMVAGELIDVIVATDYFVITNLPTAALQKQYSNSKYVALSSTSVNDIESGSSIGVPSSINLTTSANKTSITFANIISGDIESQITATFTTQYFNTLKSNLTNLRWQYYSGTNWVDITSKSGTYVTDCTGSQSMQIRLACDWITSTVEFAGLNTKTNSDITNKNNTLQNSEKIAFSFKHAMDLENHLKFVNVNSEKHAKKTITLYRGDKLSYDVESEQFTITSSIANKGTVVSINDKDSTFTKTMYSQGWFALESKTLSVMSAKEINITGSKSLKFVAWVEEEVTSDIIVDTTSTINIVNGYGKVQYTIHNFKNSSTSEQLSPEIDKNKTTYKYGTITTGISSSISISASVDTNVNHKFSQYSNLKDSSGKVYKTSTVNQVKANTLGSDIKVLFDASDTKSLFEIRDEKGNVRKRLNIYGGYDIKYEKKDTYVIAKVTDMFTRDVKTFQIYVGTEGTDTDTKVYPTTNYKIRKIYRSCDGKTTDIVTVKNNNVDAVTNADYYCSGDKKDVIDIFEEHPYKVQFDYLVKITDNGNKSEQKSISTTTAYLKTAISNADKTKLQKELTLEKEYIEFWYSIVDLGIHLDISSGKYTDLIKYNSTYRLRSVGIYDGSNLVGEECEYPTNNNPSDLTGEKQKVNLDEDRYTLQIEIEKTSTILLTFKSTLPHESDYINLGLMEYDSTSGKNVFQTIKGGAGYAGGEVAFNKGVDITTSDDQLATFTVEIPRYSKVYYTVSGDKYILKIDNGNSTIASINYTPNSNMYTPIKTSGIGWWVTQNEGFNLFTRKRFDFASSLIHSYNLWTIDQSQSSEINNGKSSGITLSGDASIVLAMRRKNVNIVVDNGSYWDANYSKQDSLTYPLVSEIKGTQYVIPGGLGLLVPSGFDRTNGKSKETSADKDTLYTQLVDATTSSVFYANNIPNIRLGLLLNVEDRSTRERIDISKGTLTTTKSITTLKPSKSGYINPAYVIISSSSHNVFDVELINSSEYRIVTIPYGDANLNKRDITGQYTEVAYYPYPFGTSTYPSNNYNAGIENTSSKTLNTISGNIKLLQSPNTDAVNDTYLSDWTVYFYRESDTRLYGGMYDPETYTNEPYYHKPDGSYAETSMKYVNPLKFGGDYNAQNYRRMLTGYTYIGYSNGIPTKMNLSKSQATDRSFDINIDKFDRVEIYPVWEFVRTYSVIIHNPDMFNDDIDLNSFSAENIFEGEAYTLNLSLSKVKLVTEVSTSEIRTDDTYTLRANTASNRQSTGDTYVFLGFATIEDRDYTSGNYSTEETTDFNTYGLYRLSPQASRTLTPNVLLPIDKTGKVKYNFIPSERLANTNNYVINLYPVWVKLGYTVEYQFSGIGYSNYELKGDEVENTSSELVGYEYRVQYMDPMEDDKSTITQELELYIDGMPFRLGNGFTYPDPQNYPNQHFDQLTWIVTREDGTEEILNTKPTVILPSSLGNGYRNTDTFTYIVEYTIAHNDCRLNEDSDFETYYNCGKGGDHELYRRYITTCDYCKYESSSDVETNQSDFTRSYTTKDHDKHYVITTCDQCGGEISCREENHNKDFGDDVRVGTCQYAPVEICSKNCGYELRGGAVTRHEGEVDDKVTTEATCTQNGVRSYFCDACEQETSTQSIEKLGHNWSGAITTNPTCTANGTKVKTCTRCGSTDTEILYSTGHKTTTTMTEIFSNEGYEAKYVCQQKQTNLWETTCSVCGLYESEAVVVTEFRKHWTNYFLSDYGSIAPFAHHKSGYGYCDYCSTKIYKFARDWMIGGDLEGKFEATDWEENDW